MKELDTNGDGKYDGNDSKEAIKIFGLSRGGGSAVRLAKKIQDSDKFSGTRKLVEVLATVVPVSIFRKTSSSM